MYFKYIPNILTLFRILIVPFFIYCFASENFIFRLISLLIFLVGSVSDFLDGFIARKYNFVTSLGKIIDPIADKILILCAFFLLHLYYPLYIPIWMLLIILFRDIIVTLFRLYLKKKDVILNTSILAKRKTLFQIIIIHFLLIMHVFFNKELLNHSSIYVHMIYLAMLLCTLMTILSGIYYFSPNYKK